MVRFFINLNAKLIMKSENASFIGIDVSKLWFDASLLPVTNHLKGVLVSEQFENSPDGIKKFEKWLKLNKVSFDTQTMVIVENTGVYHRLLWSFCSNKGLLLHIGNAAHIKWSFGIARGKSDKVDSIRLSQYAYREAESLKAMPALNPVLLKLKDLMTARTKLLSQENSTRVHLKELKETYNDDIHKALSKAYKASLTGIRKSVESMEEEISAIIFSDAKVKTNYELLRTVPGIGHLTAVYIICCTNNFATQVSGKQLACYAGVVPFEHSSGTSIKGRNRVHKMANKDLKKMLHLCALAAVKYYPEFRHYYERKKAEGKHSMAILNAVRNKIVLRAVAVVNNQRPYVDNTKAAA
jgi:transposase